MAAIPATSAEKRIRQRQLAHSESQVFNDVPSIIASPGSWDAWRHERLYRPLSPLIENNPDADWLTIGDSGGDAFWLSQHHAKRVVASSLTVHQLRSLSAKGFLRDIEIRALDAHRLDVPDETFDFTICKEAYHHFERPAVAVYEMLRVSRKAVVLLCEPCCSDRWYPLDSLKRALKIALRTGTGCSNPEFEKSGNYVYGLSLKETTKIATALQIGPLLHVHVSDFWVPAVASRDRSDVLAKTVMHAAIGTQNLLSGAHLVSWGKISIILFKSSPSSSTLNSLKRAGLRQTPVPRNPYI